jgi:hypothetical protein
MGAWEEQAKQTTQNKKIWSETQQFDFINALQNATNEEEVKAAYVREFSLPVKTQERHDLVVNKVLFEFKYSVRLDDLEVAAKVIAQAIYYINRLFKKGRLHEVDHLIIADKDEARLFKITEFQLFYESQEYQWDSFRPSSPDPKLIEAVKNSKILESNRIHRLTSSDNLHLFSSCLYKILPPNKTIIKPEEPPCKRTNLSRSKKWAIGVGVIVILSLIISIGNQYYSNQVKQLAPVEKN